MDRPSEGNVGSSLIPWGSINGCLDLEGNVGSSLIPWGIPRCEAPQARGLKGHLTHTVRATRAERIGRLDEFYLHAHCHGPMHASRLASLGGLPVQWGLVASQRASKKGFNLAGGGGDVWIAKGKCVGPKGGTVLPPRGSGNCLHSWSLYAIVVAWWARRSSRLQSECVPFPVRAGRGGRRLWRGGGRCCWS